MAQVGLILRIDLMGLLEDYLFTIEHPLTALFIFSCHFLHGVLVAIILLDIVFVEFRAIVGTQLLLLIAVEFLLKFFLIILIHSFVLIEHLVFLDHPLQVLKNHLSRQKASDECLDFNDANQGALINLNAVLFIFFFIVIIFVFALTVLNVVVLNPMGVLMLFFVRANHHLAVIILVTVLRPAMPL